MNDKIKTGIILKDKISIHQLDKVDQFIYFREKIDNILRSAGIEALGSLNKELIKKYYQQQIVGKESRKIVRVKRKD